MSTPTSEQAITALERSSKPTIELLDDAAAIIGFSISESAFKNDSVTPSNSGSDSVKFREKWILRWIIKRLNQSLDVKHTTTEQSRELLSDLKTWILLKYLLKSIPKQSSKEILLERNFCRILSRCLTIVNEFEDSKTPIDDESSSPIPDGHNDRPSKKRKLSRDRSVSEYSSTQATFLLLTSLLQVLNQTAEVLSVAENKDLVHRTCISSNWVDSVDEAAIFIAQVIQTASFVLSSLLTQSHHEGSTVADVVDTLHQWIELWQTNAKAALNGKKQDPSAAFTNHALTSALDFLAKDQGELTRPVTQAFERQIALYCLLPMRSMFQKRFAGDWNSGETELQAKTIRPIIEAMNSSLRSAASSLNGPESAGRATTLIRIASRLVPRSDMVKRKAERSWIEALFLCLSCQLSAAPLNDKPPQDASRAFSTKTTANDEPFALMTASSTRLDALRGIGIEPSVKFWRFYVRQALSTAPHDMSITTLAKVVGLNASAFVPENSKTGLSSLETLCSVLADNLKLDDQSLETVLRDVLAPVMEEFGRTRQLDAFNNFWSTKLVDAFHYRTGTTVEHPYQALWDHPTMIEVFSSVCRRHAPPSLCISLLETVVEDLNALPEVVGPTHEKFARITILSSILGSLGTSATVQTAFNALSTSVVDLIHKALLHSTDYQGHRWRLWRILEQCTLLFSNAPNRQNSHSSKLIRDSSPFDVLKDSESQMMHQKSRYMEGYQWFSFAISTHEVLKDDSDVMPIEVVANLNNLIRLCVSHSASKKTTSDSWNGMFGTMDNLTKMVSACLARLARSSIGWPSAEVVPEDFLTNLASLTFSQDKTGKPSCLATAAEAMLTRVTTSTKTSLTDVFMAPLFESVTASTVPPLLHSATQELAGEHQTRDLVKVVSENMARTNTESHETVINCLSLISESLLNQPDPAITALDLASYSKLLGRSTADAKLQQLVAAYSFIQQTMQLVFAQPEIDWHSGKTGSSLENLLQQTKEHLTEIDASEESFLLSTYTGYLSVVVARIVHDMDLTGAPKSTRKAVEKIKKHHPSIVLKQCNHYLHQSSRVTDLWLVYVLLDSLVRPQEDKSFDKKLQKLLQKLLQTISAMDPDKFESNTLTQEVGVLAKLWHILSKYMKISRSSPLPDFPHSNFVRETDQEESSSTLKLQAQLATRYPSQASILSLALLGKLSGIEEQSQTSDDGADVSPKPFLSIAAKIRGLVRNDVSVDGKTIEALGRIACLQTAISEISPASLIARLELSKLVLEKHPSLVNQHVIDSTLKSITLLASSANKAAVNAEAAQVKPEHIFDRLCGILSTLLVRYRRRLAGRYHLLLPVIQNLLRCLFYSSSRKQLTTYSSSKVAYLASLPNWLNPSTHTSTLTLPPTSAIKFSRVLQQLCDPSASSARHVSKRISTPNDNLVDEVKSLRREISQHTQYLLQTYCQVMLDGSITPDVKEKLLPGLYAVMNATDVEVMRALNTAMDASQRAIWKDLYAEWKTYGRWNQR